MKKLTYKQLLERLHASKKENSVLKEKIEECSEALKEGEEFLANAEVTFNELRGDNKNLIQRINEEIYESNKNNEDFKSLRNKLIEEYFENTKLERKRVDSDIEKKKYKEQIKLEVGKIIGATVPELMKIFISEMQKSKEQKQGSTKNEGPIIKDSPINTKTA